MERQTVDGIGGVALFADHADTLAHWYEKHLGLFFTREPGSHEWSCELPGRSVLDPPDEALIRSGTTAGWSR